MWKIGVYIVLITNIANDVSYNTISYFFLKWYWYILPKFNGLILLYCETYKSISRVSGAYDRKIRKGMVLDIWKSYARDNRFIVCESSHCPNGLTPRCRLISSSRCSSLEGFGCSPIKEVRELGSIRRESVWSLSSEGKNNQRRTSN